MRRLIAQIEKGLRLLGESFRLAHLRLRLGVEALPGAQSIGTGVRMSVTDGGTLRIGQGSAVEAVATVKVKFGTLEIGPRSFIGQGSVIVARNSIRIGCDALIGEYVTIRDQDHAFGEPLPTALNGYVTEAIQIGDNVWLGAKVTVLKGVTIGNNVVIGANSVVTSDIPANSIAVGIPARVIRTIQKTP